MERANARIWYAQGSEFTPVGVGARDVEPAYPLMKVLERITAENSPYAQRVESATQELYQKVAQDKRAFGNGSSFQPRTPC